VGQSCHALEVIFGYRFFIVTVLENAPTDRMTHDVRVLLSCGTFCAAASA
jgi:hypothetical protein